MVQVALLAGIFCGGIVVAYFVAIDQLRAATVNGGQVATPSRPFVKQLESFLRPISHMPASTASQLRQRLGQAGNPANLTPAGYVAVRYSAAALFAVVGLAGGLAIPVGLPAIAGALLWGALFAALGFVAPSLWLSQLIAQRRRQIQRSLAE